MKVYVITETLSAANETNVCEVYTNEDKAYERAFWLYEEYELDGFYYEVIELEVKQ